MLALAVAAWIAYLLAAASHFGARWRASDPWAATVAEIGEATPHDPEAIVAAIVRLAPIFGNDLDTRLFRTSVGRSLTQLTSAKPRDYLASLEVAR